MPGMDNGPASLTNSLVVSAFQSSLLHQLLVVLVIAAVLAVAWNLLRAAQLRQARADAGAPAGALAGSPAPPEDPEPVARRLLRIGFGLLWILDGILQAQPAMPVGLGNQVLAPAASGSPGWVHALVNAGVTIWNDHPITAAVATVWIQVGIGVFLLIAPRGRWSKAAALASVGWGLVVWSLGEAFGAIFAPGLSWLFGAPGGVLFYVVAGALLALPERSFASRRLGQLLLGAMGLFFLGMALLQAWPGRGFWQGRIGRHGQGNLAAMVQQMSGTSQPRFLSDALSAFASFDDAHGFAVNCFVVVALAAVGAGLLVPRCSVQRPVQRAAVVAGCLLCVADWVLVQDLGFFGGLGTDPNSMIPMALLLVAGELAVTRVPTRVPGIPERAAVDHRSPAPWIERLRRQPAYAFRSLAALGALGVVVLGAAPMAAASLNPQASPIVTEATNGLPNATNIPAPNFSLVDQHGRAVSLSSLRGKVVAITFLDPVCSTDCPLIGQAFKQADEQLGTLAKRAEFVAIVANPLYRGIAYLDDFDHEEGLAGVPNWLYLTGSERSLRQVWNDYGVQVTVLPAGAMVDHSDIAYVLDPDGHTRYVLNADPGDGSQPAQSSFADLLDSELRGLIPS